MGKITDDLKPCPFCGGKPTLHQPRGALGSWISCAQCGLEGPTETGVTEVEATAHWNTRTALSASDALTAGEREPVATVAEVFVDGKRLYNTTYPADALDKLPKGAALYTSPPASELEALRKERDEAESALAVSIDDLMSANSRIATLQARPAEALKALDETDRPTHRHKKRGSEYVLIGFGKMQAEGWCSPSIHGIATVPVDMREVAIYRSVDDDALWVRPREEFEDGRFEEIARAFAEKAGA